MLTSCTGSVGHRKALAPLFPVQPSCFIEWLVIAQRGVANARQLVGQRAGRLVVVASPLHIQSPAAHALYLLARPLRHLGRSQHTACAVREQHAQVAIPLLGDAPQVAAAARAVLARRQAKPAGEVACVLEVRHIARGGVTQNLYLVRAESTRRLQHRGLTSFP